MVISWQIIFVLILFAFMIMLPFLVAIKELLMPKDDTPLFINMFYSKDPLYFGRAFKRMVQGCIDDNQNCEPSETTELQFSKKEAVEICFAKSIPAFSKSDRILYVKGDFNSGPRTVLKKELYIKGKTNIERKNLLRAIFCEQDITLHEDCKVTRWVCGEGNIETSVGCDLGRNIACQGKLELRSKCQFQSAFARPIKTAHAADDGSSKNAMNPDPGYPEKIEIKKETRWRIVRKHISINTPGDSNHGKPGDNRELKNNPGPGQDRGSDEPWIVSRKYVIVPPGASIHSNFVSRKNLLLKHNSKIYGCIKAYGGVTIERNVMVFGDIFAEGNINIGENCIILGNVFSQASIYIGDGVKISRPEEIKSVIGKKQIQLGKGVVIFGYVLTEGKGVVT